MLECSLFAEFNLEVTCVSSLTTYLGRLCVPMKSQQPEGMMRLPNPTNREVSRARASSSLVFLKLTLGQASFSLNLPFSSIMPRSFRLKDKSMIYMRPYDNTIRKAPGVRQFLLPVTLSFAPGLDPLGYISDFDGSRCVRGRNRCLWSPSQITVWIV